MTFKNVVVFERTYLSQNFDELLYAADNPAVNDVSLYLKQKQEYYDRTFEHKTRLQSLISALESTEKSDVIVYGIEEEQSRLKQEIKKILLSQQGLYNSFLNHIHFLNARKEVLSGSYSATL
jgi:uncharacterized protein YdcH (DUF465 family)